VDVVMGSLNLGMFGLFESVKAAPEKVLATAKYVDKAGFAPENYLTAALYDWAGPLVDITGKIMEGEAGGYYPLGFDTGVSLQLPLQNVAEGVSAEIEQIIADIESGKIEVIKNTEPIE
jgi:basic membrane protein A